MVGVVSDSIMICFSLFWFVWGNFIDVCVNGYGENPHDLTTNIIRLQTQLIREYKKRRAIRGRLFKQCLKDFDDRLKGENTLSEVSAGKEEVRTHTWLITSLVEN